MIRRQTFACLAAWMLVAAPAHGAAAPAASSPIRARLLCSAPRIEATDDLIWNVPFVLENLSDRGIYSDSMTCDIEDLDPGLTHGPRHSRVLITTVSRLVSSVSARDSMQFQVQVRATCEHGRLSCRLFVHDGGHLSAAFDAGIETDPAPMAAAHPSQFLKSASGQVEIVSFAAPAESLNAPAILLIHDDGQHARSLLPLASPLLGRGFAVVSVSVPGYGRSEGAADFAGPRTMEAVALALDALEHSPGVGKRIAVWGIGRGATAAALLAARRPVVRALILQSGAYDLLAVARGTQDRTFAASLAAEAGADSSAWRARSPALAAGRIRAAVLVIHGDQDPRMPAAQAHAFAADLKTRGVDVETRFLPNAGATVAPYDVRRASLDFLRLHLAP